MTARDRTRRLHAALCLVLGLMLVGCGGDDGGGPTSPEPPPPTVPDLIASVSPASRARQIQPDAAIWCEFKEPLDPATVSVQNVRLKIDTRRLTIGVDYDPTTRRIRVYPTGPLTLRRTYTVELDDQIHTASGAALTGGYFWQFTTTTVRMPQSPRPMNRITGESPFVLLQWQGITEASAGVVEYEVRTGADSATVADSATAPVGVVRVGRFLTHTRWNQDATNWWSVRARNIETHEAVSSPAWRFECLPASTPSDTVDAPFVDNAWFQVSQNRSFCFSDSIVTGNLLTAYYRWSFAAPDTNRRVAAVLVELSPFPHWQSAVALGGATLWSATDDWAQCSAGYPGPPNVDLVTSKMGDALILRPSRVRFGGDTLSAHFEAMARFGGYYGYVIRVGTLRVSWYPATGFNPDTRARLRVVLYRTTASQTASR